MADIVDDFIQRLRAIVPDVPAHAVQQLEVQTRQAWGGTEPYVGKRPSRQRSMQIGEGLRAHKPLAEVFADAGVRRAYGYRLLGRK